MQKIKVEYTHNNSVARVILDDDKGNILDKIMIGELNDLFDSFKESNDLKLITIEGAGKHFSFGASVEEHTKENAPAMLKEFHKIFYSIIDLSVPMLAKISGQCLGGGLELALACNFLFADRSAKLGQPEIVLGVFAPPASIILPMKIGNALAEDLLIIGKTITPDYGKDIGLINEIFESREELEKALDEWVEKNISDKSASSLRYAVKAARSSFNKKLKEMLPVLEDVYINKLMETEDANEGIVSFLEKRKPVWKNR